MKHFQYLVDNPIPINFSLILDLILFRMILIVRFWNILYCLFKVNLIILSRLILVEARGLGGASEVGWQGVGCRGAATERHQEPQTGERSPLWGCWGNWGEILNVYYVRLIKHWWYAKCWKLRRLKEVQGAPYLLWR